MNHKTSHHPIEKLTATIMKHSIVTLVAIGIITIFFALAIPKLKLDANVFSYAAGAPPAEIIQTPAEAPEGTLVLDGIGEIDIKPDKGEVVTVPDRENTFSEEEFENPGGFTPVEPVINEYDGDKSTGKFSDGYVIIFSSDRMFDPEVLNTIYEVRDNLSKRYEIGQCLSPFDYVTVEKRGTRLSIVPIAPVKQGETWTEEDAELFRSRLMNDAVAKNYLYTDDGSTIMIYYRARGLNAESIAELDTIVNPLREYGRVALNGGGLISNAVMKYLNKDLITLLALCFVIMLAVYYFSFHSVRAMLLPASLSIIGIIWTLGTMALAGYKLTIVTVLTPCLVLTLGSSYSIHMVSEYFEAMVEKDGDRLAYHFTKISKTIFFAMTTTVAGFLSLLICRTPMFKEFGITISIGVFYCAILAFTYIPAVLSRMKTPKQKQISTVENGILTKAVNGMSNVIINRWYIFLVLLVVIIVMFAFVHDAIGFDSNYMSYFPSDDPIVQDSIYFAKTLGGTDPYYLTITAPDNEPGFFLKSENLKDVYAYECAVLAADPDLVQSLSFTQYVSFLNQVYNGETAIPDSNGLINLLYRVLQQIKGQIGSNVLDVLISEDASEITLSMRNYDYVEQDLQTTSSARRIEKTLDYYRYLLPEGTKSEIHCSASNGVRASDMIMVDQDRSTILSYVLTFILAAIAVASVPYGLTTVIPVAVGVMINYIFMWACNIPFDIVTVGFSSVAIGTGVDDAIHFLLRYRLRRKAKPEQNITEALRENLRETGRPMFLTTISVDAGLLMLLFASYTPIKLFGVLMSLALTAAMLASLCMLPPFLILVDKIRTRFKS